MIPTLELSVFLNADTIKGASNFRAVLSASLNGHYAARGQALKLNNFGYVAVAIALVLASCAQDVRQEVYTTNDSAQVRSDVVNSDLSDDQKKSFNSEVARDAYQPFGKTVSAILQDALRDQAADRAAAAAAAEQARALNDDLKIYPVSISAAITLAHIRTRDRGPAVGSGAAS